jgi:two-component system, sensor histidine kinase
MKVSFKLLTTLFEIGITPATSLEQRKSIRLVNILNILTGSTALLIAPLLQVITKYPIWAPGYIELSFYLASLWFNYRRQYLLGAIVMLTTQNMAAVYFGTLFGNGVPIEMLCLTLAIVSLFIFHGVVEKWFGVVIATAALLALNLNDRYHWVQPWVFNSANYQLIKLLADGIIYALSIVTIGAFIEQNERARANKNAFLRETNHELNRSLQSLLHVLGKYPVYGQMMGQKEVPLSVADLRNLHIAARKMQEISDQGMDLVKLEDGKQDELKPEPVDIKKWAVEIVEDFAEICERKMLNIHLKVDKVGSKVLVDRYKLSVVISNFLSNALRFSPMYSDVHWTIRYDGDTSCLIMEVIDKAMGMSPARRERLFNSPYETVSTVDTVGHGIGMMLAKKHINRLDGEVSVESEEGIGTVVTVMIPVSIVTAGQRERDHNDFSSALGQRAAEKSVLVIDDDEMSAAACLKVLQALGFSRIQVAKSGNLGLAMAYELRPDIIFLDMRLPDGKGGLIVKQLRTHPGLKKTLVIMISGDRSDVNRQECIQAGANDYLAKPFSQDQFVQVLSKLLQ